MNILRKFVKWLVNKSSGMPFEVKIGVVLLVTVFVVRFFAIRYAEYLFINQNNKSFKNAAIKINKELSKDVAGFVSIKNRKGLSHLLNKTIERYPALIYAVYENNNMQVVSSAFRCECRLNPWNLQKVGYTGHPGIFKNNLTTRARWVNSQEGPLLDVLTPVNSGGHVGYIRIGFQSLYSKMISEKNFLGLESFKRALLDVNNIFTIIIVLFSILLMIFILKPVNRLIKGMNAVQAGNYDISLNPTLDYSINKLIRSFNEMASNLGNMEKERREKEIMMSNFAIKIIKAQEDERKTIGRELHDEIGQFFTFLKINLKLIDKYSAESKVKELTSELDESVNGMIEFTQKIERNYRCTILEKSGIVKAIEEFINDFAKKNKPGFKVIFTHEGLENQRFPQYIEINVYRVVQEALLNILRHSKGNTAEINLINGNGTLSGNIKDDGIGFNFDKSNTDNIGIIGMQERILLMGGKFEINSRPGKGTVINFEINSSVNPENIGGKQNGFSSYNR